MTNFRDRKDVYPELPDEGTDGPDVRRADQAIKDAAKDKARTDEIIIAANISLAALRKMHQENHFVDKLRYAIRGT